MSSLSRFVAIISGSPLSRLVLIVLLLSRMCFIFSSAAPRLVAAWDFLAYRVALHLGSAPHLVHLLLILAWPPVPPSVADISVALAVIVYMALAWSSRASPADLAPAAVREVAVVMLLFGPCILMLCC
jgi:hypothetical protein